MCYIHSTTSLFRHINRPQRSWAKVIFSQACVKNSVHRGRRVSASVHAGIHPPGIRQTPLGADTTPLRTRQTPPEQADPPGPGRPPIPGRHPPGADTIPPQTRQTPLPPGSRHQHTVYEWPVRILLECILVSSCFYSNICDISSGIEYF